MGRNGTLNVLYLQPTARRLKRAYHDQLPNTFRLATGLADRRYGPYPTGFDRRAI